MKLSFSSESRFEEARMLTNSYKAPFCYGCISFATIDHFIAYHKYYEVDKEFSYQFTRGSLNYVGDDAQKVRLMTNGSRWNRVLQHGRRKSTSVNANYTPGWDEKKHEDMVRKALKLKFDQHIKIKRVLLNTPSSVQLIHSTKNGGKWGMCYQKTPTGRIQVGENMLGVMLMELREEYKKEGIHTFFKEELRTVFDI